MTQFAANSPTVRRGGGIDVYTGLLFAAFVVLVAGVVWLALANIAQVEGESQAEGPLPGLKMIR